MNQPDAEIDVEQRSHFQRIVAIGLLLLTPLGLLIALQMTEQSGSAISEFQIAEFGIVESDTKRPPTNAQWRLIQSGTLVTTSIKRDQFNSGWVAIDAPYSELDSDNLAVYLPLPTSNLDVYLGNTFVGSSGEMNRPLPFYRRPLLFQLPGISSEEGPLDTIYIRVARERNYITPGEVFIGPRAVLETEYRSRLVFTLWLPAIAAILMGGFAVFMSVLYLLNKRERAYGIFALIVIFWSIHTGHDLIDVIPFEHWSWFAIQPLCFWWVILTPVFVNRFLDLRNPKLSVMLLLLGGLLMLPILVFLSMYRIPTLYTYYAYIWIPFILLCGLIVVLQCGFASWRKLSFESAGMLFLSSAALIIGTRDYVFFFLDGFPGSTLYIRYVGLSQVAYFGLLIVRRYTKSEKDLARLNRDLENRVREQASEIEDAYKQKREMEREQTLFHERHRLMRDMHDGLGGELIRALAISEKEQFPDELHESLTRALVDLRLIVDSIAPEHNDLSSLLASLRHRSSRIWDKSGVQVRWQVAEIPDVVLEPERGLHVLRIIQEAMTNALRHGNAKTIVVSAKQDRDDVCVSVSDDGTGFDTLNSKQGFGLANMRRRAEEAALRFDLSSDNDGTRVCVQIPLA